MQNIPTRPELLALLRKSAEQVAAMSEADREAMHKAQRDGWVRAEMSWPKAKFKYISGAKVYESYTDYCND